MMVVGASARRPGVPGPRAAESHSFDEFQGRVAGANALARPEVKNGRCVEVDLPTNARSRDLRPRAPRPEGGLLTTALRLPAPVVSQADALDRACLCARVAADNKGRDVVVLDMRGITPIYD